MLFRALAYVDDFHIVSQDCDKLDGGGTYLKQVFNHTNLAEDAVGLISANPEVLEEGVPFMSAHCIIVLHQCMDTLPCQPPVSTTIASHQECCQSHLCLRRREGSTWLQNQTRRLISPCFGRPVPVHPLY